MRILITRPTANAEPMAAQLRQAGHRVVIEPMLDIRPIPGPALDLDGVQALLVTSANGARFLGARTDERAIPVYAVGDATAAAARGLGFASVKSAAGDVGSLAALVAADLDPGAGRLVHIAGSHVAGNLVATLGARKFTIDRKILYEALAVSQFSPSFRDALDDHAIDAVLFHSPRTARIFAGLVSKAGHENAFAGARALCLSPAVAIAAAAIAWHQVVTAPVPTQAALLRLIGDPT